MIVRFDRVLHIYVSCRYVWRFSSVQDGIYALENAHRRSTPSLRSFPNVAFKTLPMLSDDGPLSSFQERSSSASSFHASLLQTINGVMPLALCPPVMSQATQHFRSSEKQATCVGCFASQFICSVISLHSSMLTGVLEGGPRLSTHSSLGFPFHFPLFLASSLNHSLFDGIIDTIWWRDWLWVWRLFLLECFIVHRLVKFTAQNAPTYFCYFFVSQTENLPLLTVFPS